MKLVKFGLILFYKFLMLYLSIRNKNFVINCDAYYNVASSMYNYIKYDLFVLLLTLKESKSFGTTTFLVLQILL